MQWNEADRRCGRWPNSTFVSGVGAAWTHTCSALAVSRCALYYALKPAGAHLPVELWTFKKLPSCLVLRDSPAQFSLFTFYLPSLKGSSRLYERPAYELQISTLLWEGNKVPKILLPCTNSVNPVVKATHTFKDVLFFFSYTSTKCQHTTTMLSFKFGCT